MRLKKGDRVEVINGEDKGSRGEVIRVIHDKGRVVIDGVNYVKKHQKPQQAGRGKTQGGIIEFEAPIDVSNVMLVCPHTDGLTKIGVRRDDEGKRIRFSKKSGKDID